MTNQVERNEHPLHVLLQNDPARGQELLWSAFNKSNYSFAGTARRIGVSRLSLRRWLQKFDLWEAYQEKRARHAESQLKELEP